MDIAYEDEDLIIIVKPQGLATSKGNLSSLCDMAFQEMPQLSKIKGYNTNEGGLLNRLDNDTGGLVMFAKSDKSFNYYLSQMKDERINKFYYAIVDGKIKSKKGVVDVPIAHHPKNDRKMVIIDSLSCNFRGKPRISWTNWDFVKDVGPYHLLNINIVKGLRHQIRVHLASIGLPIVGDKLYNKKIYSDVEFHQLYSYGLDFTDLSGNIQSVRVEDKLQLS